MVKSGIYLYGYYGQGNLGDDLLMTTAIGMIGAVRPEAPVFVHCRDVGLLPKLGTQNLKPEPAAAILADHNLGKPLRFIRYFSALRRAFSQCDFLVFGGGTVLQESRSPVSIILIALMVELAHRMGTQTVLLGSGLGKPKTSVGRYAAAHVLKRATLAMLRDSQSVALAKAFYPAAKVEETADLVFSLPATSEPRKPLSGGNGIAISIQPAVLMRQDATGIHAGALLRDCVTRAVQTGRPVSLLVLETKAAGEGDIDDSVAWRSLVGDYIDDPSAKVRLVSAHTRNPSALFDGVSIHIGQRFHGHVLAALSGLPFVGLSHDVKITEICKALAMPCMPIEDASSDSLSSAIEDAGQRQISESALRDLAKRACLNGTLLDGVLAKTPSGSP